MAASAAKATFLTNRPASMKRLLGSSSPCQLSFQSRYIVWPKLTMQGARTTKRVAFAGTAFVGCGTTAFISISSTLLSSCLSRRPTGDEEHKESNYNEGSLLACSSSSLALNTGNELRFLSRFVVWVQDWIKHVWHIVLVSSRTAEIGIRLSPLIMLTPIAMLADQIRSEEGINYLSEAAWRYAISAIQGIGPVAVKLCQWAGALLNLQSQMITNYGSTN